MRRTRGFALLAGTVLLLLAALASPARAAIHEQVAAYCSGGGVGVISDDGFLEPPGINRSDREELRSARALERRGRDNGVRSRRH